MGSPKKIEAPQYPFLVNQASMCNLNFDQFVNNDVMISTRKCQIMQNPSPSSSYSSSYSPNDFKINSTFSVEPTNYLLHEYKRPAEDFMLQEFVMRTGSAINGADYYSQNIPLPLMSKVDEQMPMPVQAIMGSNFQISKENKVMDVGYFNKITEKSSDSQVETERKTNKGVSRDEVMEKSIERRRRRMIKNRESAARSRARKQAYTDELQQKALHLQTINKLLKNRKEMEKIVDSNSSSEPRHQLRRTSSTQF